jgi:hypothetical protein
VATKPLHYLNLIRRFWIKSERQGTIVGTATGGADDGKGNRIRSAPVYRLEGKNNGIFVYHDCGGSHLCFVMARAL